MTSPRFINGKVALLLVVALGVAGASGGWWYQQSLQRRPIRLWGRDAAVLFVSAPHAELWQLEAQDQARSAAPDFMAANQEAFRVLEKVNVSQARGFLHLRHSLLNDHSFEWSANRASGRRNWRYALRFVDGDRVATLLVSDDFQHAMLGETSTEASISPIAAGVKTLFEEQLGDTK
jgi:hypothetical protein